MCSIMIIRYLIKQINLLMKYFPLLYLIFENLKDLICRREVVVEQAPKNNCAEIVGVIIRRKEEGNSVMIDRSNLCPV